MSLMLRKMQLLAGKGRKQDKVKSTADSSVLQFRILPWDLDENMHVNNSRYLHYCEAGRFDLMIRSGFLKYGIKNKIIAPVGSLRIRFLRPLKSLDKILVETRIKAWDNKWVYFEHKISRKDKLVSEATVKVAIKGKDGTVNPESIMDNLGLTIGKNEVTDDLKAWIAADQLFESSYR